MHRADITAALRKRGTNQSQIARQLGVTPAAITKVVSGRDRSARVEAEISKATGFPVSRLWPGRKPVSRRAA